MGNLIDRAHRGDTSKFKIAADIGFVSKPVHSIKCKCTQTSHCLHLVTVPLQLCVCMCVCRGVIVRIFCSMSCRCSCTADRNYSELQRESYRGGKQQQGALWCFNCIKCRKRSTLTLSCILVCLFFGVSDVVAVNYVVISSS